MSTKEKNTRKPQGRLREKPARRRPAAKAADSSAQRVPPNVVPRKTKTPTLTVQRQIIDTFRERLLNEYFGPSGKASVDAVMAFEKLSGATKLKAARDLIAKSVIDESGPIDPVFPLAVKESQSLMKGYTTLDFKHRSEIQKLIKDITAYLQDDSRKRPFNALMIASPGAGKSHFIKVLSEAMRDQRVRAVTFNMATMQSADDMAQPIDELRNLKVYDRFPLLFLDEFDSDKSNYAALLPLLWDGELHVGHRDLRLGKAVIVLAGSSPDLPKTMASAGQMRLSGDSEEGQPAGKLVDLLSRINGGVIEIPGLDLQTKERDRRVDKVCLAVELCKARFGDELREIPRTLLKFIALTVFRYGVRSIAHLVEVIARDAVRNGILRRDKLNLPFDNEEALNNRSLKLHLQDEHKGYGIVKRWQSISQDRAMAPLKTPYETFPRLRASVRASDSR